MKRIENMKGDHMKKSVKDILALQDVDVRIRNLEIRYKTIPGERAQLVSEFEKVKKDLSAASASVKKLELQVRTCQSENASEREKLQSCKVRSGTVKKSAEYEAILAEIAACEERISNLETRELELYDALEKAQAAEKNAERQYKAVGRMAQKEVRELDELKEKILNEIRQRAVESKNLEKNVAQVILANYKRLLASGQGNPVSPIVDERTCGHCNIVLPPQTLTEAKKGNLLECGNCSFLIYDPTFEA